eukprot:TRINITY_DN5189_c0_g1::TRINITY_DN5189_c0_g1_i1::g.29372::m.29372 TRINITY_DN5189_c0_g1::TRINITY_DN5189_c0_g1_i1::g.29372  ORF type:complete len:149 (+),score=17.00,Cgr1/PF03879.9/3.3e+03,Cgr1/PF03879.9/0.00043,CsgE/PF10627.4/4.8,CsgE/PF10627.4/28,Peptidase_U4/PF03419.8/0.14,IncA/PF04156.9/0.12,PVL_ORF50/PF07768.6/20 TRINITY_DN5189_c0_g1_i1:40-447(+)
MEAEKSTATTTVTPTEKPTFKPGTILKPIPGRPVSGRIWKVPKQRNSASVTVKSMRKSWEEKQTLRAIHKQKLDEKREYQANLQREKEEYKKRMEAARERKIENERKSEVVQRLSSTTKIKKMTRKQRRNLRTAA